MDSPRCDARTCLVATALPKHHHRPRTAYGRARPAVQMHLGRDSHQESHRGPISRRISTHLLCCTRCDCWDMGLQFSKRIAWSRCPREEEVRVQGTFHRTGEPTSLTKRGVSGSGLHHCVDAIGAGRHCGVFLPISHEPHTRVVQLCLCPWVMIFTVCGLTGPGHGPKKEHTYVTFVFHG